MVSFQILSDLHLESPSAYDIFDIPAKAPHLALLGDIGNVRDAGFFPFIEAQLRKFQHVFLLLGNHEPYHSSWPEVRRQLSEFSHSVAKRADQDAAGLMGFGKFVFLDQTRYDVSEKLTVLGCTLYSRVSAKQEESISFGIIDFYSIDGWTIAGHSRAHAADLAWLNGQVAAITTAEPERRIVIFTHHSPITGDARAVDPAHSGSVISSAFASDLSGEECWRSTKVCMWASGHTHFNFDFVMRDQDGNEKRIVSNQRGYYFKQAGGFDAGKVVTI